MFFYDVGAVSGTPIMRSLYLMPLSASTPVFIAMNSDPKTELSMVACFLLTPDHGLDAHDQVL